MLTFKEYLKESDITEKPGNYVSIKCECPALPDIFLQSSGEITKSGKCVPEGEHHITLMYSEFSDVDQALISKVLSSAADDFYVKITGAECFDAKLDGVLQEDKKTLVLTVQSSILDTLHETLVSLGMTHSYPVFSPHITIAYDVDIDECMIIKNKIEQYLYDNQLTVRANGFESKPIEKNWSSKL